MKRTALALIALIALLLTGCSAGAQPRAQVVVTTNILGDITREIVGDRASVSVLMAPGADPHSFGVSAQQAAELEQADLVVHNGLGLEEGVQRHVQAAEAEGVPTLAVAERVDPLPIAGPGSQPDPHFWTDPTRVARAVDVIAEQIVAHVGGIDAAAVKSTAAQYKSEVLAVEEETARRFERIPPERRKLVTNHHVFGYLAQRYGFEVVGAVIPSGTTLASPSASDLSSLAGAIRRAGVRTIFADSSQPDRLARVLAEQAGLDVRVTPLFSESLTAPGGGAATYLEMTRANTEAIASGLGA
ncbi:zinc ABC transporter substrate-binding protein AztC [Saccharopolyspora flava]|uniref:Zinc/manganese transport system substrate-binding protein n=1 Tax=Saccharopolyspora flava TaxID=95161 RepID=A0A1I6SBR9_9PSEU|nr:zinc ABC transporter substrate-binding protein AztC [Saccharopolyspora flava]SFS74363.1 zinc/manganese transport system substrate-binding protein [Saccharopolyspora flava]